ncbi:MAG TPA: hypothetical protein VIG04_03085 [Gemmatimonadales bacterium]|jgi:hypothetical protein
MQFRQRAAELAAVRNQECYVVEAGAYWARRASGDATVLLEDEQITERQARAFIPAHVQAEDASIESEGTLEISDPEADTADVGVRGKHAHVVTWWAPSALRATLFARQPSTGGTADPDWFTETPRAILRRVMSRPHRCP